MRRRASGERTITRDGRIAQDEHHCLHGDTADQVSRGEVKVAGDRSGNGDRDLGEGSREGE